MENFSSEQTEPPSFYCLGYVRKGLAELSEPSTIPASTVWNCSILTKRREKGENNRVGFKQQSQPSVIYKDWKRGVFVMLLIS
ncbi:hypothetical protein COCON_G00081730 [Conger conger]|uniref:Uncharacterized protein n=1 Tax=Conger conger TaxID=82655 RepID=A0A9Q1DQJ6_CONCO|nr:hypothetical protein COCON_G00081730 [Conger conger]